VYAELQIRIHIWERLQYESAFAYLTMKPKSFVYKILPQILADDTREVQVFVSAATPQQNFRYCKASENSNLIQVVAVTRSYNMTYDTVDCQMPLLESRDANHYVKPVECGT
jgi:hypothetical protein